MDFVLIFLLNELMTLLTIIIVFPGLLPPKDGFEVVVAIGMFFACSFVWWLYLTLAPFAFLFMWFMGDWRPRDHLEEWPWKFLKRKSHG